MVSSAAIEVVPSGAASAAGQVADKGSDKTRAVLSSDFETFLKMLTTQMKYQDPLNPVESSEYATQLATFSSVEQQVLTNDLLKELGNALGGGALQQLGAWIGRDVLAEAPVQFDGAPLVMRPVLEPGADSARLIVRDAAGAVVQRLPLDLSRSVVAWSGLDASGALFPTGIYRFTVESLSGSATLSSKPAQVYNPVIEVRRDGPSVLLTLSDGSEIDAETITSVR